MAFTVASVAQLIQGEVVGDGATVLHGVASAEHAQAGDLTFAEKESYVAAAEQSAAAAILVHTSVSGRAKTLIRVSEPRVALAKLLAIFYPPARYPAGVHPTAVIASTAQVDPSACVGPHVVIGENVRVGARSALLAGNHLGDGSQVGDDTVLFPNVVIYPGCIVGHRVAIHAGSVIGADGYGYTFHQGRHMKVLQVGKVIVGDDVEIGANTCIDRAALASTVIGQGTKIDNLVHVAHNVVIGRHCLIMGQVGFAGSTRVGDYVVIASQSGIAGHLTIGAQAVIGAKSGVMRDIPEKVTVLGIPAAPDKQAKRQWVATQQLPELIRRVRDLESRLGAASAPAATKPNPPAS